MSLSGKRWMSPLHSAVDVTFALRRLAVVWNPWLHDILLFRAPGGVVTQLNAQFPRTSLRLPLQMILFTHLLRAASSQKMGFRKIKRHMLPPAIDIFDRKQRIGNDLHAALFHPRHPRFVSFPLLMCRVVAGDPVPPFPFSSVPGASSVAGPSRRWQSAAPPRIGCAHSRSEGSMAAFPIRGGAKALPAA